MPEYLFATPLIIFNLKAQQQDMSKKFFTNTDDNTLINKFEGVFRHNPNIQFFEALVGYFRASGYFRIRPFLDKVPNIRILVGINVDKLIADANKQGLEFSLNSEKTKEDFIKKIQEDIAQANYDKATENGILQFIDDVMEKKIQVKAHPKKKIHAKVYILRPEPFNEHTFSSAITGSSNLTDPGLGAGKNVNYEFNVQLSDYEDVKFATDEFEKLWAESVDILPVDIQKIKEVIYTNEVTPFELYIKLLSEYFGKDLDYDPNSIGDLPPNFKKLSYQIDAVNEGYNMLLKHNGFILADVVGLGKTIIAAMVAKKFWIENGVNRTKILVVYPPAVEQNWKKTFKDFDMDKYTKFISNGSLDKILDNDSNFWRKEEYDLIIVDEAHKFRNHKTDVFEKLQKICKSKRINKGMVEGTQKKVILVSATPLNNKPDDIYYQIQMFQDARKSTLGETNLTAFFSPLIKSYKELKRTEELDMIKLKSIYAEIRKYIIEPITIRRTRTDLENIPAYKADLDLQGIKFPKVGAPIVIGYAMNHELNELFEMTILYLVKPDKLKYSRYQAIAGLKPEIQAQFYENAEMVSKSLASIMKTQLVKRVESSFFAFKKSLERFKKSTDRMIQMFESDNGLGKIFIVPDKDINKLLDLDWSEEKIEREIERLSEDNPKNKTFKTDDFEPEFLIGLKNDAMLLEELVNAWNTIQDDPKLDVFIKQLKVQFLNTKTNAEGKLVIFSESKDTVDYLTRELHRIGRKDILSISSVNRNELYETITRNFDANIPDDKKRNEYNIILTTEVLAEGVNLHRSNVVVHYDTPWNTTRMIQRIGRVNRIGTKAAEIYNYVFYPSEQGDAQINLNKTALTKIQGFHTAFREDNQIYSTKEVLEEEQLILKGNYKEAEDERLKFRFFLRDFKEKNKSWFDKIKKLPLKSRAGRNSNLLNKPDLQNGTAVFLKTEKKFEFYWVDSTNSPKVITALEAFKVFSADEKEKPVALIDNHHEQVNTAIAHFEKIEQDAAQSTEDAEALGGVALSAKKFLNGFNNHPMMTEKQKAHIQKIIYLIDIGKYTNLSTHVDRLQKKKLNLTKALEEIDKIATQYDIDTSEAQKGKKSTAEKPILIISESFE